MGKKGTVTPLAEVLPLGELVRASDHIQSSIREHSAKLEQLKGFAEDNQSIHKLLQELPHNVSYNIMVPFGKAAFFPGKLVHTNEMMVLLGEGYYAERSVQQTLDILLRRAKFLDTTIESLNSQIADLHAEASFATSAAEEAAAGVVDIREEYDEETDGPSVSRQDRVETPQKLEDDLEHERLMARFSELEAEEAAAASDSDLEDEHLELRGEDDCPGTAVEKEEPPFLSKPPAITSPGDLVNFELWKQRTWKEGLEKTSKDTRNDPKIKTEKRVTFSPSMDKERESEGKQAIDPQNRSFQQPSSKVFGSVIERSLTDSSLESKVSSGTGRPISRFRQRLG